MSTDTKASQIKEQVVKDGKKARKEAKAARKSAKTEPEAGPSSVPAVPDASESGTGAGAKGEKKRKNSDASAPAPTADFISFADNEPSGPDASTTSSADKKSKRQKRQERAAAAGISNTTNQPGQGKEKHKIHREAQKVEKEAARLAKRAELKGTHAEREAARVAIIIEESKKVNPGAEEVYADETLSEAGRQAIDYAQHFQLSRDPASNVPWKFNKSRQNWLMQHIWSTDIPDKYEDVALDYLKSVQSGARTYIIASAKQYAAPTTTTEDDAAESQPDLGDAPPAPEAIRQRRAQQLLKLMGAR